MMQAIVKSFRQHLHIARSYPAAMLVVLATALEALLIGHRLHQMRHAIGYLFAVWVCALITDIVVNIHSQQSVGYPIKHSAAQESCMILCCTLLGLALLFIRFSGRWRDLHGPGRLAIGALIPLFVFPIVLALIYLLIYRYKPKELGINLHYWYLPLLIHFVWGATTLAVSPEKSHWHSYLREHSFITGVLIIGIVEAALSEEFTRMLLQTRLGAAFHNKGMGFVAATFIWACLHIPVNHSQVPKEALVHVAVYSWTIMPIGLLWGYMTHRTKSLLPAVLMHGLNFWGLQNF